VATAVVALRLVAVEGRRHRPAEAEGGQVHPPRAWEHSLSDALVVRSLDRTDLQNLTHARSCHNTSPAARPYLSPILSARRETLVGYGLEPIANRTAQPANRSKHTTTMTRQEPSVQPIDAPNPPPKPRPTHVPCC
jgi:hypothetical protein